MAASRADIIRWFRDGVHYGQTHMAVFMDIMDYEDYPSYYNVAETPDIRAEVAKNPERLMEVYDLRLPLDFQMSEHRAFHY